MKTRPQLESEIFDLVFCDDIRIMGVVIRKHFPRARGKIANLSIKELEDLVPLLRAAYGVKR